MSIENKHALEIKAAEAISNGKEFSTDYIPGSGPNYRRVNHIGRPVDIAHEEQIMKLLQGEINVTGNCNVELFAFTKWRLELARSKNSS